MNGELNTYFDRVPDLQHRWGWFLALGLVLIALGIVAIALPIVATFAAEIFIGWLLVIGGVVQMVHAFGFRRWEGFILELLSGLLYLGVGIFMLFYPLTGALTLTLLLAAFLVVEGVFKIIMAFSVRSSRHWGWQLANGIIALILGVAIWAGWPSTAVWVLGLFFGIDLIVGGWSFVMVALAFRGSTAVSGWTCVGDECHSV